MKRSDSFFELVAGLLEQGVARLERLWILLDGVELPQPRLHLVGEVAVVPGQDQDVVLLLLELEEVLRIARAGSCPSGLHHQQDTRARELARHPGAA